jgi:hypothetical protein
VVWWTVSGQSSAVSSVPNAKEAQRAEKEVSDRVLLAAIGRSGDVLQRRYSSSSSSSGGLEARAVIGADARNMPVPSCATTCRLVCARLRSATLVLARCSPICPWPHPAPIRPLRDLACTPADGLPSLWCMLPAHGHSQRRPASTRHPVACGGGRLGLPSARCCWRSCAALPNAPPRHFFAEPP